MSTVGVGIILQELDEAVLRRVDVPQPKVVDLRELIVRLGRP